MINIYINNKEIKVPKNTTIKSVIDKYHSGSKKYLLAVVNRELKELNFKLIRDSKLELLDLSHIDCQRAYNRSLVFIFIKAVNNINKNAKIEICHTLNGGQYCKLSNLKITPNLLTRIKKEMKYLISMNIPFVKTIYDKEDAIAMFRNKYMFDKVKILETSNKENIAIYSLKEYQNFFYGYLVPSTGYISLFDIVKEKDGIVLISPSNDNILNKVKKSEKIIKAFDEYKSWAKIMNISLIGDLNYYIKKNIYPEIIRTAEALHENKVSKIAEEIKNSNKKIILIAGPSSSGKTSFSKRLKLQLRVQGLSPITISLDDYFVNREDTPKDSLGNYDFESIHAIDLKLLNSNLNDLISGQSVDMPYYNFKKGMREFKGNIYKLTKNQPIIIEGIHGLNPLLTQHICDKLKYKIYVSALTQVSLDSCNRIATTDTRLIRRIVRDYNFRGFSASRTIGMWKSVRNGEERNIFPYQETADAMFNSALVYELAVLKKYVVPLLEAIKKEDEGYIEANRLLEFLKYIVPIEEEIDIPPTSLLREFIGGSRIVD